MAQFGLQAKLILLTQREMSSKPRAHSRYVGADIRKRNRSATALIVKQVLKLLACSEPQI